MNEQKATYGTGPQEVSEPDSPTQLRKENPKNELPQKVGAPDGRVLNLDTGEVTRPGMIEISGRKIDISEFGEKGARFLREEMYESFLTAVHDGLSSRFEKVGEGGADTSKILDEVRRYDHKLLFQVKNKKWKTGNKERTVYKYLKWTQDHTFEDWISWTICTLRWRINYELQFRANRGVITHVDAVVAKEVLGEYLVTCEKYMSLSERERMIGI